MFISVQNLTVFSVRTLLRKMNDFDVNATQRAPPFMWFTCFRTCHISHEHFRFLQWKIEVGERWKKVINREDALQERLDLSKSIIEFKINLWRFYRVFHASSCWSSDAKCSKRCSKFGALLLKSYDRINKDI